jgi:hypothetical protein
MRLKKLTKVVESVIVPCGTATNCVPCRVSIRCSAWS